MFKPTEICHFIVGNGAFKSVTITRDKLITGLINYWDDIHLKWIIGICVFYLCQISIKNVDLKMCAFHPDTSYLSA